MTSVEFREAMMVNLCLLGNGYAMIERTADFVSALYPMRSSTVTPRWLDTGRVVYDFNDRGKVDTLPAEKVFHGP